MWKKWDEKLHNDGVRRRQRRGKFWNTFFLFLFLFSIMLYMLPNNQTTSCALNFFHVATTTRVVKCCALALLSTSEIVLKNFHVHLKFNLYFFFFLAHGSWIDEYCVSGSNGKINRKSLEAEWLSEMGWAKGEVVELERELSTETVSCMNFIFHFSPTLGNSLFTSCWCLSQI